MVQPHQRTPLSSHLDRDQELKNPFETRDDVMNSKEDIVNEILAHLPSSDLSTCMRISRLWYAQASRHLYRNVTLDENTMPSFLYGLGTLYDDIRPCRATMAEGIWKDCDHETAERLDITSQPRTHYNFKAPLLRFVQTLTLSSHHRCTCAPSGPLIHRLLSNLKILRVVRSVCGCPNSCAINALCDSASCPFLNCFAEKYVFRNNDGDCASAASSRMDRHRFLHSVEGRENRTTVVLPRKLGLLHNHGASDIAFRVSLERATSLKIVFADWEGCVNRPNALSISLKDAKVVAHTIGDLLEGAPRCSKVVLCGLEKVELAVTRGSKASLIDEDDLRTLRKQIEDHIKRNIWVQRPLPDTMVHSHDPHTGDIVLSFGSTPPPVGGGNHANANNSSNNAGAQHSADDVDGAVPPLPGAGILNILDLLGNPGTDTEDDDASASVTEASVDDEEASDPESDMESASDPESDDEAGATTDETGSDPEDDSVDEEDEDEDVDEDEDEDDEEDDEEGSFLGSTTQDFLTALTAGWTLLGPPPLPLGIPGPSSAIGASTNTTQNSSSTGAAQAGASAGTNATAAAGSAQATNPAAGGSTATPPPTQSLLAAFQEFVATISRTERKDGEVSFKTFEEYLADEDSRGELSLE